MIFHNLFDNNWLKRVSGENTVNKQKVIVNSFKELLLKLASKFINIPLFSKTFIIKDSFLYEIGMSKKLFLRIKVITTVSGFILGVLILIISTQGLFSIWILFVFLFSAIGFIIPELYISDKRSQRNNELDKEFPQLLDLLYLYSGSVGFDNIGNAIVQISFYLKGLIGDDLRNLSRLYRYVDKNTYLSKFEEKFGNPFAKDLVSTLRLTSVYGGNISQKIGILSRDAHNNRIQKAKQTGQRLSVVLMIPLMFFHFPVAVALLLAPTILSIKKSLGL